MKKHCKNIDIADLDFIKQAIVDCLRHKKKSREDIVDLLKHYTIDTLAKEIQQEILSEKLVLKPIWYKNKYDQSSGKTRRIGVQDIKQQIYDYIAVNAMRDGGALARIGRFQFASLPNRGQIYGAQIIFGWLQHAGTIYAMKCDVKKYYPSIDRDKLMQFLNEHIKNTKLLWLIRTLLDTFESGLSVGSYLSQYLANLYMSILYHEVEQMYRIRASNDGTTKRVPLVAHQAYYMDDVLFLGPNKRDLFRAKELADLTLSRMGVEFKPTWTFYKVTTDVFIDMMGFRIYRDHITVRRQTLKKTRRAMIRFSRKIKSVSLAKRVVSYVGNLEHSDSYNFMHKYNVYKLKRRARKVISNYDRSIIRQRTAEVSERDYGRQNTCSTVLEW